MCRVPKKFRSCQWQGNNLRHKLSVGQKTNVPATDWDLRHNIGVKNCPNRACRARTSAITEGDVSEKQATNPKDHRRILQRDENRNDRVEFDVVDATILVPFRPLTAMATVHAYLYRSDCLRSGKPYVCAMPSQ
jgi:hypothetical protein